MAYNNLLILGARRAFIAEINEASDGRVKLRTKQLAKYPG